MDKTANFLPETAAEIEEFLVPGFEALENGRVIWGLGNGSAWALIITLQVKYV